MGRGAHLALRTLRCQTFLRLVFRLLETDCLDLFGLSLQDADRDVTMTPARGSGSGINPISVPSVWRPDDRCLIRFLCRHAVSRAAIRLSSRLFFWQRGQGGAILHLKFHCTRRRANFVLFVFGACEGRPPRHQAQAPADLPVPMCVLPVLFSTLAVTAATTAQTVSRCFGSVDARIARHVPSSVPRGRLCHYDPAPPAGALSSISCFAAAALCTSLRISRMGDANAVVVSTGWPPERSALRPMDAHPRCATTSLLAFMLSPDRCSFSRMAAQRSAPASGSHRS
jgi:hypothetical protein